MAEFPDPSAADEIEDLVRKESERAIRRFRSSDFPSRLQARLQSRRPAPAGGPLPTSFLVPAFGLLLLAVATAVFFLAPRAADRGIQSGFRFLTGALGQLDIFAAAPSRDRSDDPSADSSTAPIPRFAEILFRGAASSPETGDISREKRPPLRPLFSPGERVKILFRDKAIERVLAQFALQNKEV